MRTLSLFFVAGLLTLLAALPVAGSVLSHAKYARSEPAADEVLSSPPSQVKVWFTQELFRRKGENWLRVTGPDGSRVDLDDAAVDDDDRTLVTVSLSGALADGAYTVAWRALSADDGHTAEGEFGFILAVNPTPAPPTPAVAADATATAVTTAGSSPAAGSGGLPCLGAAPWVMLALGGVLVRRRKQKRWKDDNG